MFGNHAPKIWKSFYSTYKELKLGEGVYAVKQAKRFYSTYKELKPERLTAVEASAKQFL